MRDLTLDHLAADVADLRRLFGELQRIEQPAAGSVAAHALVGAAHTASGLTTGQPLRATGATSFAFGALDLANANAITGVLPVSYLGTNQSPQFDGLQIGAANGAGTAIQVNRTDAGASNTVTGLRIDRYSTSSPAAGIGARIIFGVEDDTQVRDAFRLDVTATNVTDATFKARAFFGIYDVTAVREGFRLESDGANPMIGFLGATAVVRPSSTTDLRQALINLGLYTSGGATPLDLNGGALTAGGATITTSKLAVSGATSNVMIDLSRASGNILSIQYGQNSVGTWQLYMPASAFKASFAAGQDELSVDFTNHRVGINNNLSPSYTLDVRGTIYTNTNLLLQEQGSTPAAITQDTQCDIYMKADKLVIRFNNAGTIRYKYLDLTGTGVTWTHTTSAP
ncbi:MAG: hypothetical protein IT318_24750 [Anaerolineales bacterium]|nr:hypothetical protein [Anaerolineales bacterium]